jgi:hypothetical protein
MKNVHNEIQPLTLFLKDHGHNQVRINGRQIIVENVKHDDLKLLVHKFLHHEHLDDYKVHSQPGFIEIVSLSSETSKAKLKEAKGRRPTSSETMPYLFPG